MKCPSCRRDMTDRPPLPGYAKAWGCVCGMLMDARAVPKTADWISIADHLPADGVTVNTKIHGPGESERNVQPLKRRGQLWFFPDESMYVYYTPTHWKTLDTLHTEQAVKDGGS